MIKKKYALIFTILLLVVSCSTKKNTFKNRSYHKMTAWFNTLFNGQVAMDKKLVELEKNHQDNYFKVLPVNPIDEIKPNADAKEIEIKPSPNSGIGGLLDGNLLDENDNSVYGGFEKAEEKALKAIANHSMEIKGEERNKLISRAYLMLGQARYYQGKPFQALDALEKVKSLPFEKHKPTAEYYAAKANIQAGNKYAAADILDKLYKNDDLSKKLKTNVAKTYAELYYNNGDLISALNGLDRALEFSRNKKEKARLNFIQGQILTELKRYDEANQKFELAYKLKPGFEMEARAKVFYALNFDPKANEYNAFKNQIMKAYDIGTYEAFRNEFLYALGKIEEKRDSVELAEKAYKQSLKEQQSDAGFRAETFASLGDLKFNRNDYIYAKAYYDSAAQVVPKGKRGDEIVKFRDNLKHVLDKYYLVKRNDSVLKLVNMSEPDRKSYFQKYIEKLKEIDEEKAIQEEKAKNSVFLTQLDNNSNFSQSFGDKSGKFYFYNNSTKINGELEFQKLWGKRRLQDNWRLSNSKEISIEQQKATLTGNVDANNPRRYDIEFYLEKIPTNNIEIAKIKEERDTVELSLGLDYIEEFKNIKRGTETLEHLVNTPPKNQEVLLKAYYNLYRINVKNNKALSDKYKNILIENYPNSLYAEFILNPQSDFTEGNNPQVLAMYEKAYASYKEENYDEVKALTQSVFEQYPKAGIMAKFLLLNAFIDAKLLGKDAYKEALEKIVLIYPHKPEGIRAKELLEILKNGGKTSNKSSDKIKENKPKRKILDEEEMDRRSDRTIPDNKTQSNKLEVKKAMKMRKDSR